MNDISLRKSNHKKLTIYVACDGFGEKLKNSVKSHLANKKIISIKIKDLGCDTYFDSAAKLAKEIQKSTHEQSPASIGILFCGTGMGVSIVANKFPGIRAALCENTLAARYSRAINDANVLCLGELITTEQQANLIVDEFLSQEFMSHPLDSSEKPAEWWNNEVEAFLKTSKQKIKNIEDNIPF